MNIGPTFALFLRAIREEARQTAPYAWRVGLLVVIGLSLYSTVDSFASASGAPGLLLFSLISWWNLAFIALTGALYFSNSITEEKEEGTLPLLRMTKLSALSILLGKSASRLFTMTLLLATQFPLTLLAVTLGGVSLDQVARVMLLLLAAMLLVNGIGTLSSTLMRRTRTAVALTMGLCVGIPLLPAILGLDPQSTLGHALLLLDPVRGIFHVLGNLSGAGGSVWPEVLASVAVALGCYLLAWLLFNRFNGSEDTRATSRTSARKLVVVSEFPRGRPPSDGALAWKETRYHMNGYKGWLISLGAILGISLAFLIWMAIVQYRFSSTLSMSDVLATVMCVALLWGGFQLLIMSTRNLSSELYSKTLSALYLTGNTGRRVFWSKFRGMLWGVAPALACSLLCGMLLTMNSHWFRFEGEMIPAITLMASFVLLAVLLNQYFSLSLRWTACLATGACLFAYGFAIAMFSFSLERSPMPVMMMTGIANLCVAGVAYTATVSKLDRAAAAD